MAPLTFFATDGILSSEMSSSTLAGMAFAAASAHADNLSAYSKLKDLLYTHSLRLSISRLCLCGVQ